MKIKGNVRAIDELGRVVIPIDYRKVLGLTSGDLVDISMGEGNIVIKKLAESCSFCGGEELLTQFKGKTVCMNCLKEMAKAYN